MNTEDHIQQAIEHGRRNKEILPLIENWCAKIRLVNFGGVGMIEAQMGLPVGHKRLECPHASLAGIASSHLDHLAVDFYDRHCHSCQHRVPVRMPNLLVLVEGRDRERAREQQREQELAHQASEALSKRRQDRKRLWAGLSPSGRGLLDLIDRVDAGPDFEDCRVLVEAAKSAPEAFIGAVGESLVPLSNAGGEARTATALEALAAINYDADTVAKLAFEALARREALELAGHLVQERMASVHLPLLAAALPALVELASSSRHFPSVQLDSCDPDPLLRAFELFPDLITSHLTTLLTEADKWPRVLACDAIDAIRRKRPASLIDFAQALLQSIGLPDDDYDFGSSASRAARLLSHALRLAPARIDALVQDALQKASGEREQYLFRIYFDTVGRGAESKQPKASYTEAERLAFDRIVSMLATRRSGEPLGDSLSFLRDDARDWPRLVDEYADRFLGIAALIASDLDETPYSPLLDPRPEPLKALEAESRRMQLQHALHDVTELVGWAGARNPRTVGAQIIRDIDTLPVEHERLKGALVEALGTVGATAEGVGLVLPTLYGALTARSQRLRAAGARAYREITSTLEDVDELPLLLHETFLVLLSDPYVVVHRTATRALREVRLPKALLPQATAALVNIINVYAASKDDDDFLGEAIRAFISLMRRRKKMSSEVARRLVRVLVGMEPREAEEVIDWCGDSLEDGEGFPDLLVKLLADRSISDYAAERLSEHLWRMKRADVVRLKSELETVAAMTRRREYDFTDDILQILSEAGEWRSVENVASRWLNSLEENDWNRWQRVRAGVRLLAAQVELAAVEGRTDAVPALRAQWMMLTGSSKE